jgi:hypothetical protein
LRPLHYVLRGHTAVPVHPVVFGRWFAAHFLERSVGEDFVGDPRSANVVRISTVFLGLDHQFNEDGPPILFETMIFGGTCDGQQARYSTWDQAEKGHRATVEAVRRKEEKA